MAPHADLKHRAALLAMNGARATYADAELDAILATIKRAPNRTARRMVDALIRSEAIECGRRIHYTQGQLNRMLAVAYRVWGQQPHEGEAA